MMSRFNTRPMKRIEIVRNERNKNRCCASLSLRMFIMYSNKYCNQSYQCLVWCVCVSGLTSSMVSIQQLLKNSRFANRGQATHHHLTAFTHNALQRDDT